MPSVTVIVVNSRGVPPAAATPFFAACAWRDSAMLHGAASFQVVATPISGWLICSVGQPHRVEEGAVRRPLRADRHMAARQARLVDRGAANVVRHFSISLGKNGRCDGNGRLGPDQHRDRSRAGPGRLAVHSAERIWRPSPFKYFGVEEMGEQLGSLDHPRPGAGEI